MPNEQKKPAVSVIMATYNTPTRNLTNAIKSILDQDFQNFELLVADDASDQPVTETTDHIQDERLIVIRHSRNLGPAAARNSAIKSATGQYIVLIDADDWVKSNYISTLYQAIEENPEYAALSCRAREFRDDGSFGPIVGRVGEKEREHIIRRDVPVHGASIMRRSDLVEVGGYPHYRRGQDYALWCEMILAGKRLNVIEPILYHYRVNEIDYKKRKLKYRRHSISASLHYYPKLGASILDYRYIVKSIIGGVLPSKWLKVISERTRNHN